MDDFGLQTNGPYNTFGLGSQKKDAYTLTYNDNYFWGHSPLPIDTSVAIYIVKLPIKYIAAFLLEL